MLQEAPASVGWHTPPGSTFSLLRSISYWLQYPSIFSLHYPWPVPNVPCNKATAIVVICFPFPYTGFFIISGDPWYKIVFIAPLLSTDIIRLQLYYTYYIRRNQVSAAIFSIFLFQSVDPFYSKATSATGSRKWLTIRPGGVDFHLCNIASLLFQTAD